MQIHLALIFAVLRPPEGRGLGFTCFLKTRKNSQFFSAKHKYISEALCFSCCQHYNSYITVCSSFQRFRENRMGLWSNQAIAYNLHCKITATYPRVKFQIKCLPSPSGVKVIHLSLFLLSLYLSEIHYTHLITIPVELDFQVTGVEGDLVPSPRIFLAGGPLASSQVRFLLVPVTCLASGVFSAFGSSS